MTRGRQPPPMDDALIRKIFEKSLGDRFSSFGEAEASQSISHLEADEGILHSLAKRDLIRVAEAIQLFATILSPRLALHALVQKIAAILEMPHCSMILLDLQEETGTVAISHEDSDFEGVRIALGDYPEIMRSVHTGKITVVENPTVDPMMHSLKKEQMSKIKDISIMVLPLVFEGTVFGVLLVRKQRSEEGFTIREVRICQLMVNMVLLSLQRMYWAGSPLPPEGRERFEGNNRAEAGCKGTTDLQAALLALGPVGAILLDGAGRIQEANPKASELLGMDRQTLLTTGFHEIVPDQWLERIRGMRKLSASGEKGLSQYHFPYRRPDGRERILSVQRHPLPGEGRGAVVFFRDATKEKQMEDHLRHQTDRLTKTNLSLQEARGSLLKRNEELQRTNERLDELNKQKTHFLAVATHEIRTPLSIIMGYNRFLFQEKPGDLNPEQRRILDESVQSCERLLNIVNEMLDFSRIESGKLELQNRESDVLALLRRVYRQMKIISDRERIELVLDLPAEPLCLVHDPDRIEQVLVNLISNAIKFTEAGGVITLSAQKTDENGRGFLEVSISDTGVGLSPSMQDTILKDSQPFLAKEVGPAQAKGVGLGLAISKKIVEAHGGRIWAEGSKSRGATFKFTLPLSLPGQGVQERNLSA